MGPHSTTRILGGSPFIFIIPLHVIAQVLPDLPSIAIQTPLNTLSLHVAIKLIVKIAYRKKSQEWAAANNYSSKKQSWRSEWGV
jgi:hypothetical protein